MESNILVRYWVARSLRTFHVIVAVAAVGSYAISALSGEAWLAACGNVIAVAGILHFFIHTNLHRKYNFSTDYHRTYSLPQKKIQRINAVFLVILVIAVCVGMVMARELYSGTLIAKLQMLFMYILHHVFGMVFSTEGLGEEEILVQQDRSLLDAMNGIARQTEQPWEETANFIQTIVIIIGLLVIVALGIMAAVNVVRRTIASAKQTEEEKIWRETLDREERLVRMPSRKEKRLGSSPADRIRRVYQRCINRNRRKGQPIPEWMTPSEIEFAVALPQEEQYQVLHTLYQKARYSEDGCTDQEAKQTRGLRI